MAYGANYLKKGDTKTMRARLQSGATAIGVSFDEYIRRLENGEAWCSGHQAWEAKDNFYPDASKASGVRTPCRFFQIERMRQRYAAKKAAGG